MIGIYDSGIGGMSVVPSIRSLLPAEDLLYVADSGHLPYGEKPVDFIIERALSITAYFLDQGAKAIAIPCNTATAAAIGELRRTYPDLPFIGIEPAVKPAAQLTRTGVIGVLATTGTLLSRKFRELVEREAPGTEVLLKPCPGWVDMVERGVSTEAAQPLVSEPIEELLAQRADVLVLGCTHFPFLMEPIRRCVGRDFPVLETGMPFAREVLRQLQQRGQRATEGDGTLRIVTSGDPLAVQRQVSILLGSPETAGKLPAPYLGRPWKG